MTTFSKKIARSKKYYNHPLLEYGYGMDDYIDIHPFEYQLKSRMRNKRNKPKIILNGSGRRRKRSTRKSKIYGSGFLSWVKSLFSKSAPTSSSTALVLYNGADWDDARLHSWVGEMFEFLNVTPGEEQEMWKILNEMLHPIKDTMFGKVYEFWEKHNGILSLGNIKSFLSGSLESLKGLLSTITGFCWKMLKKGIQLPLALGKKAIGAALGLVPPYVWLILIVTVLVILYVKFPNQFKAVARTFLRIIKGITKGIYWVFKSIVKVIIGAVKFIINRIKGNSNANIEETIEQDDTTPLESVETVEPVEPGKAKDVIETLEIITKVFQTTANAASEEDKVEATTEVIDNVQQYFIDETGQDIAPGMSDEMRRMLIAPPKRQRPDVPDFMLIGHEMPQKRNLIQEIDSSSLNF